MAQPRVGCELSDSGLCWTDGQKRPCVPIVLWERMTHQLYFSLGREAVRNRQSEPKPNRRATVQMQGGNPAGVQGILAKVLSDCISDLHFSAMAYTAQSTKGSGPGAFPRFGKMLFSGRGCPVSAGEAQMLSDSSCFLPFISCL